MKTTRHSGRSVSLIQDTRLRITGAAVALMLIAGCATQADFSGPRRLAEAGQYPEAIRAYEAMRGDLTPESSATLESEVAKLRARYADQVLADVAGKLNGGETLPRLQTAISTLEAAIPLDDAGRRLATERARLIARIEALRTQMAGLSAAATRAANGDYQGAIDQMTALQSLAGELTPAQQSELQRWISNRDESKAKGVRALLQKRDAAAAEAELKALATLKPAMRADLATALIGELTTLRQALFMEAQQALIAENHFYPAYRNLKSANFPAAQQLLEKVRTDGAAYYLDVTKREGEAGNSRAGYAYFAIIKAKELSPTENPEITKLHRIISDLMERFITTRIGVAGFRSPSTSPDIGSKVSDSLITYLYDQLPHGIKLVERSQVDKIMGGNENALETIGKQLDLEILIVGNVGTFSVERKHTEGKATEMVTIGTKSEPNPLYAQYMELYGKNTAKWPSIPPQTIEKPERQQFTYNRGDETLTGIMVAYVQSCETASGLLTGTREFTATATHKDSFHDAVKDANIEFDGLDLPSDNTVLESMRADLVKQIATEYLKRYALREKRYLDDALDYLNKRKEKDIAVLQLAGGHYYTSVAKPSDPVDKASVERIDRLGLLELTE